MDTVKKDSQDFFINIGRSNKLQTHNLIGMINEFTKNRNLLVGKIDIFKNFSFFEVEEAHENLILKSFLRKEWNGEKLLVEKSKAPKEQDTKLKSAKKSRKRTSKINSKQKEIQNLQNLLKDLLRKNLKEVKEEINFFFLQQNLSNKTVQNTLNLQTMI